MNIVFRVGATEHAGLQAAPTLSVRGDGWVPAHTHRSPDGMATGGQVREVAGQAAR